MAPSSSARRLGQRSPEVHVESAFSMLLSGGRRQIEDSERNVLRAGPLQRWDRRPAVSTRIKCFARWPGALCRRGSPWAITPPTWLALPLTL